MSCKIVNSLPDKLNERMIENGHEKIKFNLVRHGAPNYEVDGPRPIDLDVPIQFEGTLKEEGKNQIILSATNLINEFSDSRSVMTVASPRRRAFESKHIASTVWKNGGITVSNFSEPEEIQNLLTDATLTGALLEEYNSRYNQDNNLTWMEFWINESANFQNVESAKDFRKRMEKLLSFFQKFSLDAKPETNIVCFTHEEEIKVLSSLFGISVMVVPNGTGLKLTYNPEEKIVEIEVQDQKSILTFEQIESL